MNFRLGKFRHVSRRQHRSICVPVDSQDRRDSVKHHAQQNGNKRDSRNQVRLEPVKFIDDNQTDKDDALMSHECHHAAVALESLAGWDPTAEILPNSSPYAA